MIIDKTSAKPYYEQIILMIKEQVMQGILQPGEQIPSVREMARQLLMNPNTVSKAYKLLEVQRVIVTVKGRGTYIADRQTEQRDLVKQQQLQERLDELVLEASYLGVSQTEMTEWLATSYGRGQTDANDSKRS
ncbi:GntR family transcriptional regulator [Latilactobacillus fuchuensis]|uniref:Transcriptional regulator (GntR family) n=1 Tax=Latilactobacillus fuchuensis TaxID=164393 RepID=A0A2N9DWQ5_9LACO|nr:GntR family transcriptional regulator [Latilactobacillus fuchuensis]SPC39117.1 transcriptional regulator (GntR family) [Latilactobacillus fuchuensis]